MDLIKQNEATNDDDEGAKIEFFVDYCLVLLLIIVVANSKSVFPNNSWYVIFRRHVISIEYFLIVGI